MDYILTVDVEKKTISGTNEGCSDVISVRGDISADNIVFSFSEAPNGFDLENDIKRIYYQPPWVPGVETILLTDVEVGEDATLIYWPVTASVAKAKGVIFFNLVIEKVDENNAITKRLVFPTQALTIKKSFVQAGSVTPTEEEIYEERLVALETAIAGKQPMLTFDDAPIEDSDNPVKSGGVFSADESMRNDICVINSYDIDFIQRDGAFNSFTNKGITYTWNADGTCTLSGTSIARSVNTIINARNALPDGINPGDTLTVNMSASTGLFGVEVISLTGGEETALLTAYTNSVYSEQFTVPDNAEGLLVRIFVPNGRTLQNVLLRELEIIKYKAVQIDASPKANSLRLLMSGGAYTENAALQAQITANANDINKINSYDTDIIARDGTFNSFTHNGITYVWGADGSCTLTGTSNAKSINTIINSPTALPDGVYPGDTLTINMSASSSSFGVEVVGYPEEGEADYLIKPYTSYTDSFTFTVPNDCIGLIVRLFVSSGVDLTTPATLYKLEMVKLHPKKMSVPLIVSFVDDDTTSDAYVEKYHDACAHNGVKGNFAVLTDKLTSGDTTASTLIGYEDEGFGMLIHCDTQSSVTRALWENPNRTDAELTQCRTNLTAGLRKMRTYGFVDYAYWIAPYGRRDSDLVEMAKGLGLRCMVSTANLKPNTPFDSNKFFIKRVALNADDTVANNSLAKVKEIIDDTVSSGCGWLIVTTHFNSWGDLTWDSTLDDNGYPVGYSRFNELVQYAINAGLTPMSFQQAWAYYEPILTANLEECNRMNAN